MVLEPGQAVDPAYPPDSIAGSGMERLIRDGIDSGMRVPRLFTMDRVEQSGWRGVKTWTGEAWDRDRYGMDALLQNGRSAARRAIPNGT